MQNTMHTVQLKAITHRDNRCLAIYFGWVPELKKAITQVEGVRWSQTQKCWWLPLSMENYRFIVKVFQPLAQIDDHEIHQLADQSAIPEKAVPLASIRHNRVLKPTSKDSGKSATVIHLVNVDVLFRMK